MPTLKLAKPVCLMNGKTLGSCLKKEHSFIYKCILRIFRVVYFFLVTILIIVSSGKWLLKIKLK